MSAARTSGDRWRLGYRPALDGIRGAAILAVLVSHAHLPRMAGGGQVGVTLFFVLSGFLISTLILEERRETGRVSLARFYMRRALRLLPALFAMLAVTSVIYAVTGMGHPGAILAPLLYVANWAFVSGMDMPLTSHTWTLSIEEQFYLLWPIALIGLMAIGLRWGAWFVVAGIALSTVMRVLVMPDETRMMWSTDTRADALLMGALVAIVFQRRAWAPPGWLVVAAIGCLLVSMTYAQPELFAYGGLTLTAASSAVLVAHGATREPRFLILRPLVYVGTISYGLYLWHRMALDLTTDVPVIVGLAISFGLAWASMRLIEAPALRLKRRWSTPEHQGDDPADSPRGIGQAWQRAVPESSSPRSTVRKDQA